MQPAIETHPDFARYLPRDECERQKKELLDKYACHDGYKYFRGHCLPLKSIGDYPIKDHPDFKNFLPKSAVEKKIQDEVKKRDVLPIEEHPDYCKLKQYMREFYSRKLLELSNENAIIPIEEHPDYLKLMEEYACSKTTLNDGTVRYLPCSLQENRLNQEARIKQTIKEAIEKDRAMINCNDTNTNHISREEYDALRAELEKLKSEQRALHPPATNDNLIKLPKPKNIACFSGPPPPLFPPFW